MNLRDMNNTVEGYKTLIEEKIENISKKRNEIIELEKSEKIGVQIHSITNNEVIYNKLKSIYLETYDIFMIKYSMGEPVSNLLNVYISAIGTMADTNEIISYTQLINLLSVGILLETDNNIFYKMVKLIKNEYPKNKNKKFLKDYLIDLLINHKIPEIERENKQFFWKKTYAVFEEIELLARTNKKDEAIKILKKYLQKQWLPTNNTQSRGLSYHCGYWSFESGAIVKIFELNDVTIKDLDYYPYDMVHWKK